MTYEKRGATSPSHGMAALGRLGRVTVFFATVGFAYPHVFVENIDMTKVDAKNKIKPDTL